MRISIKYGYVDYTDKTSAIVTVEDKDNKVTASFPVGFEFETKESINRLLKRIESAINECIKSLEKKSADK